MKVLSALIIFALLLTLGTDTLASNRSDLFPPAQANLEVGRLPEKVELTQPAFMATITSPNAILKWKPSKGAKNYHLQIATDPNFKWLRVDEHQYQGTEYEVRGLEEETHYYWRVAPTNNEKWAGSTKGYFSKSMFQTK
jgi:hypothetical protein